MGNRKQGFKAKTLEQAIDKLKTGEPLTEKEVSLCVKILSKKVIKEAIVDTSEMNEFFGFWKHVCPSCGAEVTTGDENTTCLCGQMLRCPPYSEWHPKFIKDHVYDETEDKWVEGKPAPKEPASKDTNTGRQHFIESERDRLTRLGIITPSASQPMPLAKALPRFETSRLAARLEAAHSARAVSESIKDDKFTIEPKEEGFPLSETKEGERSPKSKTKAKAKSKPVPKSKTSKKQKPQRHKAPSTRATRTRRIT